MLKRYFQKTKEDILLLTLLGALLILVKYPIATVSRDIELFNALRYLPESLLETFLRVFHKWPPGPYGYIYRPLQIDILPYLYFQLFQFNHHGWLAVNLMFSALTVLLCYVLVKVITNNRIAAFFSALFLFSYCIPTYSYSEAMQYVVECLHIVFYLLSVTFFILYIHTNTKRNKFLSLAFFILGLLSKELTGLMPLVLVIFVLIYKFEMIKTSYDNIKAIVHTTPMSIKAYIRLFTNRNPLVSLLFPYFFIWGVYMLWRVIIPAIKGNLGDHNGVNSLIVDPVRIFETGVNILVCTFQLPFVIRLKKDASYSLRYVYVLGDYGGSLLYLLMLALFIGAIIMFVKQIKCRNKTMLFGLFFYLANISIFPFLNAPFSPHHIVLSFVGIAIMFGEAIRIASEKLISQRVFERYQKPIVQYSIMLPLVILFSVYAYISVRTYIKHYETIPVNKFYQTMYDALPRPEDRKSNTIFYIKGAAELVLNECDHFYMCILPSYYGKKNITVIHEFQIDKYKPMLAQMKASDYTIVVLKYVNKNNIFNITDESAIKEFQQYMINNA